MEYGELRSATAPAPQSQTQATVRSVRVTLLLCTAAALFEGFDNQSMGVAAPRLVPEFGLSAGQASVLFSAATFGLFLGAAAGGRIADRYGRRPTLSVALLLFGVCSVLTALTTGADFLRLARLLTGLGLGAAMPNFIALASEAVPATRRLSVVTLIMAGMPFGGALAAGMAMGDSLGWSWRSIFYVGGGVPIVLSWLTWRHLYEPQISPDPRGAADRHFESVSRALFGAARGCTTVALWGGFFFTQLVLLLMLNWLPSLLVGFGYTHLQASIASISLNVSGAVGAAFYGYVNGGSRRRLWVAVTYVGMVVSVLLLPLAGPSFALTVIASALAGVFIIGAQLVLFALAPLYYPRAVRGTGVGAAVAVGRLGSVVGPLYAGALLSAGGGSTAVLFGITPFIVIGGLSAWKLATRAQSPE